MFTLDEAATLYVYIEYIFPLSILVVWITFIIFQHYLLKFKIYRIHKQHDVVKEYNDTYWYDYKCAKCGKLLYKKPSSVNTELSSTDYIFRYIGKCTGVSNDNS